MKGAATQDAQFLLGKGGQKCGTTWIYSQLMRQPWFAHGDRKEYRVFDQANPNLEVYAKTFRQHLEQQPDTNVCADITPAYALLEAKDLKRLRVALETQHFQVRALFVMRDPLERIWSQVRMHRAKGVAVGQDPYPSDQQGIEDMFRRRYVAKRTRYSFTVRKLEQVFHPKDLQLIIYEQMFNEDFSIRLGTWLGKPFEPLQLKEKIHSTPKREELNAAIQSEVVHYYGDVYQWGEERFGPHI
jgi:hypothetical protein